MEAFAQKFNDKGSSCIFFPLHIIVLAEINKTEIRKSYSEFMKHVPTAKCGFADFSMLMNCFSS